MDLPFQRRALLLARQSIPLELIGALPRWWRSARLACDVLFPVIAVVLFARGMLMIGWLVLLSGMLLNMGLVWIAIQWLRQHGLWQSGSWYADWLPGVLKMRAILLAALGLASIGAYLMLEKKIHSPALAISTISFLVFLPILYIWGSIRQGMIGTDVANTDFREESPVRFWLGLATYTTVILFIVLMVSLLLLNRLFEM